MVGSDNVEQAVVSEVGGMSEIRRNLFRVFYLQPKVEFIKLEQRVNGKDVSQLIDTISQKAIGDRIFVKAPALSFPPANGGSELVSPVETSSRLDQQRNRRDQCPDVLRT